MLHAALPNESQVTLLIRTYEDVIALTKSCAKECKNKIDVSGKIGVLLVEISILYDKRLNKLPSALTYLQKALDAFKQSKDYKQIANTLSLIGVIHVKNSAYPKALKCFQDSLVMQKVYSQTKETAEMADTLHNIGNCEARMGRFKNSLPSFEEAIRIKKTIYPPEHISIAKTLHCKGLVMSQLGNLDDAHKLFQSALDIRRALLGNDHLDVSFSLHR